jgi:hypothetical protein
LTEHPKGSQQLPNSLPGINAPPILRTLGVQKAANHTAQSQLEGWVAAIDSCCNMLARSPLGQCIHVTHEHFGCKIRGMLTDHASDQKCCFEVMKEWKRQCDRKLRGETILNEMTEEAQLSSLSEHLDKACKNVSGWEAMSVEQRAIILHDTWQTMLLSLGEKDFQKLSEETKQDVEFIAWIGCGMHKELNAAKGGATAMAKAWNKYGLIPPIPLRNKADTIAHTSTNPKDDAPTRGAVKLVALAGAVFNHKDKKKGQHDTCKNYFEVRIILIILRIYSQNLCRMYLGIQQSSQIQAIPGLDPMEMLQLFYLST